MKKSPVFSTPAIILRCTDFGDNDVIITLFTLERGKLSVIAKSAKKSTKRFAGILDLFSVLEVVCKTGRGKLPVLQEAVLKQPFEKIRCNIWKAAYACYWAELINEWVEENEKYDQLYSLFYYVLEELDAGRREERALSILFQMRLMSISGFSPNLRTCSLCGIETEDMKKNRVIFDLVRGGLVCEKCASSLISEPVAEYGRISSQRRKYLSKGTIKQLLWVENGGLEKAGRVRFTSQSLREGLDFLEGFVPYHLGKSPRSLSFLRKISRPVTRK